MSKTNGEILNDIKLALDRERHLDVFVDELLLAFRDGYCSTILNSYMSIQNSKVEHVTDEVVEVEPTYAEVALAHKSGLPL